MEEVRGEKCGVFGIFGKGLDVSRLTFFGLYALQHRGQESSGISAAGGGTIRSHRGMGLVSQVFTESTIAGLFGHAAIGHNRYSTAGGSHLVHAQPFVVGGNELALAHNGNLPSTQLLEQFLTSRDVDPSRFSDSKMIAEAIALTMRDGFSVEDAVAEIFPLMTGAFSILILTPDSLIALRDAHGIRPLALGRLDQGYVFASESCAFHPIGARFEREVRPGEMLTITASGMRSTQLAEPRGTIDVFEFVYFARPDSVISGKSVYEVRKNFGTILAREAPLDVDVVVPVPETGVPVAIAYADALNIPFDTGLIKNRYIHRTFIEPEQHIREQGVRVKLTPLPEVLKGKRVAVVDDSIVRGTTSRQLVRAVRDAGATAVHLLISSPPVRYPDFYGIDIPDQSKLIAASKSVEEIREYLGADSLTYISYEGMVEATGLPESALCTSCFSGRYPLDIRERVSEILLHR